MARERRRDRAAGGRGSGAASIAAMIAAAEAPARATDGTASSVMPPIATTGTATAPQISASASRPTVGSGFILLRVPNTGPKPM